MYPTKMEANGRLYKINTDFRIGLACFRALNDFEITDTERFYAVQTLLLGENVLSEDELILKKKIETYLRCGRDKNTSDEEIDFDYIQDEQTTRTSIRQCYHLNLNEIEYLHWYEYNELISGLTTESLLNKIRDLRNYDLSDVTDEKQRAKIIETKERVALKDNRPKTEEEKELDKFWDKITG